MMLEEKGGGFSRLFCFLNGKGVWGGGGVTLPDGAGAQDKALYVQSFHQDSHAAV